jgi:hypothetical protein
VDLDNGSWTLHLEGFPDANTDDLTLDDVELAEEVCGVPYTLLNPHASAREAKALLVVLLVRAGVEKDTALQQASQVNLRQLAHAFTYNPPSRSLPATDGEGANPPH